MVLKRHDVWSIGEQWADQGRPRLLVIDNYDSFTYNLVLPGESTEVKVSFGAFLFKKKVQTMTAGT